jgi:hypothetical protein
MPAKRTKRNTGLAARADSLRKGDVITVFGADAEVCDVLVGDLLIHALVTVTDSATSLMWTAAVPCERMVPVVRFAAATDAEFNGL